MGVHKPYNDVFYKDPLGWAKSFRSFFNHTMKKDPGMWLIYVPTAFGFCYAAGMIITKCLRDPNIIAPLGSRDHMQLRPEEYKNTNKYMWSFLVKPHMKDGWEKRDIGVKVPEDIE